MIPQRIFTTFFIFYYTLSYCNSQMDDANNDFCRVNPTKNKNRKIPEIPDRFSVTLEINEFENFPQSSSPTTLVDINYNKQINQISLKFLSDGNEGQMIVNFNSKQIFSIHTTDDPLGCSSDFCTDGNCAADVEMILPQLVDLTAKNKIFSGLEIFGLSENVPMIYIGEFQVDEIWTDRWDSCYKDQSGYWRNVSIYWTVERWNTSNLSTIPIYCRLSEEIASGRAGETRLKPINYRPNDELSPEIFQPHETVFCPNWPSTKEFSKKFPSNVFGFETETLIKGKKTISQSKEWFDLDNGLIRIDYQPDYSESSQLVSLIFDYSLDVVYIIEGEYPEQCQIQKSDDFAMDITHSPSAVNLMSKKLKKTSDFFEITDTDFVFIGERVKRGLTNFVWQGVRSDVVAGANISAIWEWYFLKTNFNSPETIPTRRSFRVVETRKLNNGLDVTLKRGDQIVHNIYGFQYLSSEKMSDNDAFDISSCYALKQTEYLEFQINVNVAEIEYLISQSSFRYKWRQVLASKGNVNILRIFQVNADSMEYRKLFIKFKIVDVKSADFQVLHPVSLKQAIFNIRSSIDNGEMSITWINQNQQNTKIKAMPQSLRNVEETCLTKSTLPPNVTPTKFSTEKTSSIDDQKSTTEGNVPITPIVPIVPIPSRIPSSGYSESSKFSSGTATGLSFGCFFAGFFIGAASIYGLKSKVLKYFI